MLEGGRQADDEVLYLQQRTKVVSPEIRQNDFEFASDFAIDAVEGYCP